MCQVEEFEEQNMLTSYVVITAWLVTLRHAVTSGLICTAARLNTSSRRWQQATLNTLKPYKMRNVLPSWGRPSCTVLERDAHTATSLTLLPAQTWKC
ncbi:hypothetical protein WJX84_001963 [Apatococcus fuscideae]|uniref:Secreted protein n=1 Tax=Apatococcus fuscideae TaxID=2026836 RepID=A0AAW1SNB8_9CHLO